MKLPKQGIYHGKVVHVRTAPKRHVLSMNVFELFINLDEMENLSQKLHLFSFNRFNLFSVNNRKWGARDGTPLAAHVRNLATKAAGKDAAHHIFMLCFPALLGRVFNPLTTYYCYDEAGELRCLVFEVSNTFGEHHTYVVPADQAQSSHPKRFHVSPFNKVEGSYSFTARSPAEKLRLGVRLDKDNETILNTWFEGKHSDLNDWALFKALLKMPLLPLQVLFAIHWEAFKLWRKGLSFNKSPAPPSTSFTVARPITGKPHA
jgi:DUF1365 family protein